MKKIARLSLMLAVLALSACGYHLVGHGGGSGAIPADVKMLSIVGNADAKLLAQLRQRLHSDRYVLIGADGGNVIDQKQYAAQHAVLHVSMLPLRFTVAAFDRSGVATQYRMSFQGSLRLEQQGKSIWQSGPIQSEGNIFVSAGPSGVQASRQRLMQDLSQQWLADALGRIRSGF